MLWLANLLSDGVTIKTPVPPADRPLVGDVLAIKPTMTKASNMNSDQMGQPLDHQHVNKRAHWQPRTNAADANRGQHVKSRTHVWNANREKVNKKHLHICTYNPQSISDLTGGLDIMLLELERVKWGVIGISASQIKETCEEVLPEGHYLFNSGNDESRTNGVGFLAHKSIPHLFQITNLFLIDWPYCPFKDVIISLSLYKLTFQHLLTPTRNWKNCMTKFKN